jgi:NDP-sugar pyrophosphorylase family protein
LNSSGRVTDIGHRLGGPAPLFLFTGIYIVEPAFFARIPAQTKLSVIPIFMEMIKEGAALGGVVVDEGHWWDLGTREQYLQVHRHLNAAGDAPWVHPSARIAPSAQLIGATSVGAHSTVGENAILEDCIIWENATIQPGSSLKDCIVTAGATVGGTRADADLN